ncbi:ABC transporter substrate-binding protein [Leucobacter salsicius]|uniref:ABC transporter substrate-binding protein n=1 Tax=Leucobacter salsicius TaxID=664638 RepID=UPI0003468F53|nr:ABC transporter substrate-binding protein [Leucobacter salsicius]
MSHKFTTLLAVTAALALTLAGCSGSDPLATASDSGSGDATAPLVIGSQDYYSNEIIAELYAQALEAGGYEVDRQLRIGQREVYLPELEAGTIDLMPEYTGNLLQFWQPDTEASTSEDVYAALKEATPEGLRALEQSPATDQDSYVVTAPFAQEWQLESIGDLANVTGPITLGANSEAESRPYGPAGLASVYGVAGVKFTPIEDSGGPLTLKALQDDDIQLANIYSADPSLSSGDVVTLADPKGIFLASHVVPIVSDRVDEGAAEIINAVSAALQPADLVELNARSVNDELPAKQIAADWLGAQGLA